MLSWQNRFEHRNLVCLTHLSRLGVAAGLAVGILGLSPHRDSASRVALADAPDQQAATPCSPTWVQRGLGAGKGSPAFSQAGTEVGGEEAVSGADMRAPLDLAASGEAEQPTEPNETVASAQANTRPDDALFRLYQKRSLLVIGALQAWETSYGGSNATIAVIADGVEYTHPDLASKMWRNPQEIPGNHRDDDFNGYVDDAMGWDFASGDPRKPEDSDPMPVSQSQLDVVVPSTGTAMAGIAAADTNNTIGLAGVSWGARIMPIKILSRTWWRLAAPDPRLDPDGDGGYWGMGGNLESLTRAICYAANNGADVIAIGGVVLYNPRGAENEMARMQEAITYARQQKGALLVAGAGECGQEMWWCRGAVAIAGANPPAYPAAFEHVIGVQSFGPEYQLRPYASWGDWVDLAAPGEGFSTLWRDGNYQEINSTFRVPSELAAAHVAGVLAVMKSLNPGFGPLRTDDKLCETANRTLPLAVSGPFDNRSPGGWSMNERFGCGVLNFERAVEDMPWQVQVSPRKVVHMVDHESPPPPVVLSSAVLNEGHWEIVSGKDWLQPEPLPQDIGRPSEFEVNIDGEGLQRDQGPLQGERRVYPEVVARAVNQDNPAMAAASTSQKISYEVYIVDRVWHAFLPSLNR